MLCVSRMKNQKKNTLIVKKKKTVEWMNETDEKCLKQISETY